MQWPECGVEEATKARVGVVGVRAGIVATGTLVVGTAFSRGRSSSRLPPIGVLPRAETIVDTPSDLPRTQRPLSRRTTDSGRPPD
jgi:L-lactate utilization protein LutC